MQGLPGDPLPPSSAPLLSLQPLCHTAGLPPGSCRSWFVPSPGGWGGKSEKKINVQWRRTARKRLCALRCGFCRSGCARIMRLFFQGGNLKRVKLEMPKVCAVEHGWGVTARSKYMGVCVCVCSASIRPVQQRGSDVRFALSTCAAKASSKCEQQEHPGGLRCSLLSCWEESYLRVAAN